MGPKNDRLASVRIAGTGSYVPPTAVSNDEIAGLVTRRMPGKGAAWAFERLAIRERRFMSALDRETGRPVASCDEIDMAETAARKAIADAGLEAADVDGLWYVTCTQTSERQHFGMMAHELHRRLGLTANAPALEMDAGCGGALHAMINSAHLLAGSGRDNLLVVASNGPSTFFMDWEAYVESGAWLSMYVFGDGAGAVLLRAVEDNRRSGIIGAYAGVDPARPLMQFRVVAGARSPVYYIDAKSVAATFGEYARAALLGLRERCPFELRKIDRFYFHQVNGHVLRRFVSEIGIPAAKVASHVDRYGNMAAAATLVLLDEDRRAGVVKQGDLCIVCTVGAGAQYGAMLVRL